MLLWSATWCGPYQSAQMLIMEFLGCATALLVGGDRAGRDGSGHSTIWRASSEDWRASWEERMERAVESLWTSAVTSQRRPGGLVDPDCGTQVIRTLLKPATTAATRPLTRTEPPRPARPECWFDPSAESTRSTRIRGALSSIVSEADPEQAAIRVVASSTPMPRNRFFMLPGAPPFAHSQVYDGVRGGSRWEDVRPAEPSDLAVEGPFDIDRSSAQGCQRFAPIAQRTRDVCSR